MLLLVFDPCGVCPQAVLQRELVVPEVYDVMVQVQELMVRSQAAPVRQACSALLLQFLLDYPVGERRLQQHLNFIITNLSYEHETGREATIDMLKVKYCLQLHERWCDSRHVLPFIEWVRPLRTRLAKGQGEGDCVQCALAHLVIDRTWGQTTYQQFSVSLVT